ncbi:MAG: flagellar hook assembly protein FlgD [Rickettsiales bacterium]
MATSTASTQAINDAFVAARDVAAKDATTSKTSATASLNQLSSDVNFFLTMLTTQLKNQDPTSSMDTAQFTAQIAQYSGVQQQVTTNANLEKLIAANKGSATSTAVSYIGKEVETAGNTSQLIGGQGAFSYILPATAQTSNITIKNSLGQTVFTGKGTTDSGRNLVIWDGVNSITGKQEADGIFTIGVEAVDAAGKTMKVETRSVTLVAGVETDSLGNALLTSGNVKVNFNNVLAVRTPTRAQLADTGTSVDTTTGGSS